MTQLTQTQVRFPSRTIAGVALAAAVIGGIVGAVVKAAQEWETRYRQMYPNSR